MQWNPAKILFNLDLNIITIIKRNIKKKFHLLKLKLTKIFYYRYKN